MTTLYRESGVEYTGPLAKEIDKHGRGIAYFQQVCGRCGGEGGSRSWSHTGYTCYQCGGSGKNDPKAETIYTAEALAKLQEQRAKREAKREAAAVKRQQEHRAAIAAIRAEFDQQYPGFGDALQLHTDDKFLGDLHDKLVTYGKLTEKQVDAAKTAFARIEERATKSYVGNVGDTIEVELTTVFVRDISYTDGYPQIYRFIVLLEDADGNTFKYVGNSNAVSYERGSKCKIKASIKSHDEYNGTKQTVIQRPRSIA